MKKAEEDNSSKLVPPKLITFSTKKSAASKAQNLVKIYQDESSVSRALCFFQSSEEHTREAAFSHEWTAYPSSLFEVDPMLWHLLTGFSTSARKRLLTLHSATQGAS